jgi:hypothetical protein
MKGVFSWGGSEAPGRAIMKVNASTKACSHMGECMYRPTSS